MRAIRGSIFHCLRDPGFPPDTEAVEFFEDALLIVDKGIVEALGPAEALLKNLPPETDVVDYSGKLLLPGFIDCHVHYPQLPVIASYGTQLLEWLEAYTFPAEAKFSDYDFAYQMATAFVDEMLKNGTTTAMVFATVHPQSVDAIFTAAQQKNLRLIAGKVLMDRNCPDELRDSAQSGYVESKALIEKWHAVGRLEYAITPRFAPTSTPQQLRRAGDLANEYPDVRIQTHLAENQTEIDWVATLFPESRSYLDVYQSFDLVREGSVFAHCIHLDDTDLTHMSASHAAVAFCPSSNLFLGSGLFDLARVMNAGVQVGFGTDIGAGTSLSMFETMADGYKVMQLGSKSLSAYRAFYLATLGGAQTLKIDDQVGNFQSGKEADFIVIERDSKSIISQRCTASGSIAEELFVQMTLADDRAVHATYVMGELAYEKESSETKP